MKKIALVNVGFGNLGSVVNSISRINYKPIIVSNGDELFNYSPTHIVMPGVGAVGEAMIKLEKSQFIRPLEHFIRKKIYFCGICVGMQILANTSEEFGITKCLGWIPGEVKKLDTNKMKLPHMGWNTIYKTRRVSSLLDNIYEKDMYFCHTFAFNCAKEYVIAETNYEQNFVSAINKENIYGIQCHPEKSLKLGDIFFKNFLSLGENNI